MARMQPQRWSGRGIAQCGEPQCHERRIRVAHRKRQQGDIKMKASRSWRTRLQRFTQPRARQEGKLGYILLWLLGIPIPVLIIIFLLRGCT